MRKGIISLIVLGGCHSMGGPQSAASPVAQAAQPAVSCELQVDGSSVAGELVAGDGFTVCVPETWRPSGAHGWEAATSVRWTKGPSRARVVTDRPSTRPRPGLALDVARQNDAVHFQREMLDGGNGELWHTTVEGKHRTGAVWYHRQLTFEGVAKDQAAAALQLAVFRSVSFSARHADAGPPNDAW